MLTLQLGRFVDARADGRERVRDVARRVPRLIGDDVGGAHRVSILAINGGRVGQEVVEPLN